MKKPFIFLTFLLCITFQLNAQSTLKNHPGVDYNDVIVGEHRLLLALVTDYLVQTVHSDDFNGIEQKRKQVIGQIDFAINKIKSLGDFEGDTKMRDEALAVLAVYKEAYTEDFNTINSLKANSQQSFEAMAQYLKAEQIAEIKLNSTLKRFNKAQQEFAKRHELVIDNSEGRHPMDIIFEVYKYNRAVFLQYFKVFIQNEACLNALAQQDSKLLEVERQKLATSCKEALTTLTSMTPYKEDAAYKKSAIAYVTFHQKSANHSIATLVSLFEKESLSQADVNTANQIIDQYNIDLSKAEDDFHHANILLLQTYIPQKVGE